MAKTYVTNPETNPKQCALRLDFLLNRVLGMNPAELARQFNFLNESTIRGWINCVHGGLTQKGAVKIITVAKTLGINITLEWLLYGIEPGPTAEDILTVFKKQSEHPESFTNEIAVQPLSKINQTIIKELEYFSQLHPKSLSYKVTDDAMLHYLAGDVIAGIVRTKDFSTFLRKDCIIKTTDKRIFFRNLHEQNKNGSFNLRCTNPNTAAKPYEVSNIEIVKIAEVIWHRRKASS